MSRNATKPLIGYRKRLIDIVYVVNAYKLVRTPSRAIRAYRLGANKILYQLAIGLVAQ